jgi:hypothetical protein
MMENKRTKRVILSCVVILAAACLCLGVIFVSGVGVSLIWPLQANSNEAQATPTSFAQDPENPDLPNPSSELPQELADALYEIEMQVVEIRGLEASSPIDRTLISTDELEKIVVEDFFAEYSDEDARQDVLVLSLLGLLPEEFSLKSFYQDLFSEQIAGFYDDEIQEIYVVQGETFGGNEKLTYAHEFTHVLQDQVYGLSDGLGLNEESCEEDSERCAAVQALIEGDATKTELLWFQSHATFRDYRDIQKFYSNFSSPMLDSAPPYMAADLVFPYEKGLAFVEHLYEQNGFNAVDEAYRNNPVSTEQILHPEKYPADEPLKVTLPDLSPDLGEGWSLFDQNVMGEWYTFLILNKGYEESHRIPEETALEASAGWGGDAYAVYQNSASGEALFVMDAIWDSVEDAEEFAAAFEEFADKRWGVSDGETNGAPTWSDSRSTTLLQLDGSRTLWLLATDSTTLAPVLDQFE